MKRFFAVALAVISLSGMALAQEMRSTLTGRVTDPTGAIVPNAQIEITNTSTGAKTILRSNSAGSYTAPFLAPGPYSVQATMSGFKTYIHSGLELQTEQTVVENIVLAVGEVNQTVTVTAQTPLVDVATASTGQELTAEEVEDLPSNGRSPIGFAHLEYGAVAKGKHSESQVTPFGNSTGDDFSLGGGASSSNELLLNGVPNMEDSGRTSGFSPELDAVNAVHVDEFAANAALGDTSGGTVNITTKSGTNSLHGTASEYYAGSRPFTAEPYFTTHGATVPSTHFNQYAATIGGPVEIPHLVHGRNKLFFFYAFEGYDGNAPNTIITTVPTQAERNGDFSNLLTTSGNPQLYNPFTAALSGKNVVRSAIPGNVFSNAGLTVSPIAQAYLKLVPMPNYTGPSAKPDGENNFFASDPTTNRYKSNQARIDWTVSDLDKAFFEFHRSHYTNAQNNIFSNALSGTTSTVNLLGGQADNVKTFSPSLSLETRLGFSRYETFSGPNSLGQNPTTLGLPGYLSSNSTVLALPVMSFSDSNSIPTLSGKPGNVEYYDNIQLFASLNKTWGRHSFKFGPDFRSNKDSAVSPGNANGNFTFKSSTGDFVTSGSSGQPQGFGGSLALFELGLATSGSFDVNTRFQYNNWYMGYFAQDDWKVMPNLTLSIGLRLEHETPLVESNNQLVVGWNPATVNAVTAAAATAYAAHPISQLPASSFSATGGINYATSSNRSPYSTAPVYVSPRFGFSYAPGLFNNTLAIRGGFGIYVNPFNDYNAGPSYGFSNTTNMITSTNNNLSPATTVADPFPTASNPIVKPYGSTYGINTNLGNSIFYYGPVKVPYSEKWSFDIQKQFGQNWLAEVGYLGDHQVHNSYTNNDSAVGLLPFLVHQATFDKSLTTTLNASTTNPFYGIIPGPATGLNSSKTVSVASLLHSYPEYTGVSHSLVPGASANFNALMLRLSKRMSQGLEFNFNYEYSRQLGYFTQLNAGGPLWYGETTSDFPNHASVTVIYQLPFGKGRMFLHDSTLLSEIIGGWEISSIYQYLSGTPLSWGNVIYNGTWSDFHNNPHDTTTPSFNTSTFDTVAADQPNGYNYRTFPQYLLRSDPTKNFDFSILKDFTIGERMIIQPRVDAFNAFNRPQFNGANSNPTSSAFGTVSSQLNTNRTLQGGIHFLF
ncbi:MAG: TonB-dependent receptor [Acidobacteriota bacterium]|nr:TonB-dependent receptor [Acidobacteriota bacterium]